MNRFKKTFTLKDILSSFSVLPVSTAIFAVLFALAAVIDGRLYWIAVLLFSGSLVRSINRTYENRTKVDLQLGGASQPLLRPAIAGLLVGLLFATPLMFIGFEFVGSTTYLKMALDDVQSESEERVQAGVRSEFASLLSLDQRKVLEDMRRSGDSAIRYLNDSRTAEEYQRNNNCITRTTKSVQVAPESSKYEPNFRPAVSVDQPEFITNETCYGSYTNRIASIDSQIKTAQAARVENIDTALDTFARLKKWATIFLIFLLFGIVYYPLGLGLAGMSAGVLDGVNVFAAMTLAAILKWDYAKVFCIWTLFVLVFALTLYWEFTARGTGFYEPQPTGRGWYLYSVTALSAVVRLYLLVVLGTWLERCCKKNKAKIEALA